MLKKFPSDKINGTENALFFLFRASTDHSFTFKLQFLYELEHKFCLCQKLKVRFIFIKVYIFV